MTNPSEQQRLADAHWAAVCNLSHVAPCRLGVRQRLGALFFRAGLRLVRPLTVEALVGPARPGVR